MAKLTEIPVDTIDGQPTSLAAYAGKVLLIVNVASKCGFTPQYKALEALYDRYKDAGLVVLGFPANDFGAQEPGTDAEIASFCSLTYNVTFPMFSKIVVTGEDKHPLYRELIAQAGTPVTDGDEFRNNIAGYAAAHGLPAPNPLPELLWNFEKFLVDRKGQVVARFGTEVTPEDPRVTSAIEAALSQS
jgi:glutathione peroxidase